VAANLEAVRARIRDAGGDPERITIVAVTKQLPVDAVRAAVAAGLVDIGENYAQQLLAKAEDAPAGVRWHFLGRVQRNKVPALAPLVHLWQAVDRPAASVAIADRAPGAAILVQVNVTGSPGKHGCTPAEAPELVDHARALGLDVRGLMAVGPQGPPEDARPAFRRLAGLARTLELPELSMGMSGDLEVGVQEGATIVRVGTSLFGPRPVRAGVRR
jgi:pyridoxal phosphate enzyme (YggS family)